MDEERTIKVNKNGLVAFLGIEHPYGTKIIHKENDILVIKVPGHMFWCGRGESKYASPETFVYRITEHPVKNDDSLYRLKRICSWENKRKPKSKEVKDGAN